MTDKTLRGRFVWHELITPDAAASHVFYSRVLGWKTRPWEQNPSYMMFTGGGGPLGATVASDDGAAGWIHYIGTPDLDATLQQATELGASVVKETTGIAGGARYAVLTDPQGALFAIYASPQDPQPEHDPRHEEFSWMELGTTDAKAALNFYCGVFGWERNAVHDMGPLGFYYLFSRNGREIGGVFDKPAEVPGPPAWLGYVRQKDMDAVVNAVKAAGGSLINGPMEVPGGDWIAQFLDPHGAMFAVHLVQSDIKSAGRASSRQSTQAKEPAKKPAKSAAVAAATPARKPSGKAAPEPRTAAKPGKKKSLAAKKRAAVKTAGRSGRKAVRVGSLSVKVKARATGRTKAGIKAKKSGARPKKGK